MYMSICSGQCKLHNPNLEHYIMGTSGVNKCARCLLSLTMPQLCAVVTGRAVGALTYPLLPQLCSTGPRTLTRELPTCTALPLSSGRSPPPRCPSQGSPPCKWESRCICINRAEWASVGIVVKYVCGHLHD